MPGIGGALDIAGWSMYAAQLAMEVTSNNIANANTEGYSKQTLQVRANNPINVGPGAIGTGVKATEVTRAYDAFMTEQVAQKSSQYQFWSAQKDTMDNIQTIFNESDGNGMNALMGQFWNSWGDLANNPDGVPERQALLANTDNLIASIHGIDKNLRDYQTNIDSTISGDVNQVNSITKQIGDLNNSISSVEIKGSVNANDLRDRRDLLLNQLSKHLDISYYEEQQSGQVMVYALGGTPLVLGKDSFDLSTARDITTGHTNIIWNDGSGRTLDITHKIKGGDMAGLVDARDNQAGGYLDSMNKLTDELVWQVNSLHSEGSGLQPVTQMTGTVTGIKNTNNLGTDFSFSDRYNSGGAFDIVAYDASGNVTNTYTINPGAGNNTVGNLISDINTKSTAGGNEITASLTADGRFQISANGTFKFAIKPDASTASSNALAILGTNTFFSWDEQVGQPVSDLTQTIDVNSVLKTNPEQISSGYLDSNNKVAPGSNDVANAIFDLQDKVIPNMGGSGADTTMDSYYSSLVAQVGVDVQKADQNEKYYDTLLTQYTQAKESASGVNIDEEMTELLKYQHLYQASAKLISICDDMIKSLLSIQ
jgi:flagellar hook-associated protein 1